MEDNPYEIDAYRLDTYIPERLVEETYGPGTLARLTLRRALGRLSPRLRRQRSGEVVVANYAGLAVLDRPGQHRGGLAVGRDFPRVLNELGIGRRRHLFEFCAGPGYIGYSLFAAGWCDTLTLSDIDPSGVETARRTAALNGLEGRVSVFESDVLDGIPEDRRWDLVVANPPHFLPDSDEPPSIQRFDPDWTLHRRFYSSIGGHLEPGGVVVMVENSIGADINLFEQMIEDGGGRLLTNHPGVGLDGRENGVFYQVSEWGLGSPR
jgi:hypothetical protein